MHVSTYGSMQAHLHAHTQQGVSIYVHSYNYSGHNHVVVVAMPPTTESRDPKTDSVMCNTAHHGTLQ